MKLPKLISKLLGRKPKGARRNQDKARAENVSRIEARGYKLVDVSGRYNGRIAPRRYILTDPTGITVDNGGEGFASSADALRFIVNEPRI